MMNKILTSHVGSLPRTQKVVDFIFARENEQPFDQAEFDSGMTAAVDDTVAKQVKAGVDIVSGDVENLICDVCQRPLLWIFR
jgi:5-methyltetrahydropteroyltriglutamate--homocysteine methyltransferase